ncbi:MAG: 2-amino-4-hydroxy-6-hydroxymethyldihydropteridine diphosphokinase [Thermodesulfobacteriota bacterium]
MYNSFIGIGSNLGMRIENCNNALEYISAFSEVASMSSLYKSEAAGYAEQPNFINAVIKIKTSLSPNNLLNSLKLIEKKMGREKTFRWGPRIIDLDILFYENLIIESSTLTIPHEELQKRRFVLEPLLEIEPDLIHPKYNMSIKDILKNLKDDKKIVKIGEFFCGKLT